MGFFSFLRAPDLSQGLAEFRAVPGAVLLDVRTPEEYRSGHVPESKNLPLQTLDRVGQVVGSKSTPLFVYCYSGSRSRQAAAILSSMGYKTVKNIGGIAGYRGEVEYT